MGANNSSHRVSFESDENDNITVVKGIRLSENVIKRMREPNAPNKQSAPTAPAVTPPPLRPVPPLVDLPTSLPPPPPFVEAIAPPPATQSVAAPLPKPPTEQPTVESLSSAPESEPAAVPLSGPVSTPAAPPAVNEEALRKKITDELYKDLEQKRAKAEQEMQAWYDAEKARASAHVQAEAESKVREEISKILSAERALTLDSLQQAIIREQISSEDERLRTQLLELEQKAKQLEAREADLKKQDAFYREQVARLEERSAQLYKVTTENYHKAADEINAKFKRYEVNPVCGDLQGQILGCYKDNVGKTLNCSNIAALYLQCVNDAKQNQLRTGG
ncbi:coiled-coil-helix-coiled-coil-helix domain containing 3a isoform X1 [Cyprinodon tularosa]|uniref:coiled-coil-helix-coiled-coil-helix domain containing 3a isoform X1 n=1 Tax=Cyprinodon tularosa TaxID=77115 RepID=UPI0018E226C1|nr:coiled-coil-helix-coiled-coil-helix domain containing 3a isoform X1 [Cyprinodon tularosa]